MMMTTTMYIIITPQEKERKNGNAVMRRHMEKSSFLHWPPHSISISTHLSCLYCHCVLHILHNPCTITLIHSIIIFCQCRRGTFVWRMALCIEHCNLSSSTRTSFLLLLRCCCCCCCYNCFCHLLLFPWWSSWLVYLICIYKKEKYQLIWRTNIWRVWSLAYHWGRLDWRRITNNPLNMKNPNFNTNRCSVNVFSKHHYFALNIQINKKNEWMQRMRRE